MSKRIIIIEDEERILDFLRRGLSYEGYQVETAVDGSQGLIVAYDTSPDLVILDWMLPEVVPSRMLVLLSRLPWCPCRVACFRWAA
ncbi:MAG TPA: response regulator [Anaerolineae bacterium]|nr:response regulator [Anaerolineae bacterium]